MTYQVIITPHAQRRMRKLEFAWQERILQALHRLGTNPRGEGNLKLTHMRDIYRMREGDFRILYQIKDRELLVLVVDVAHRGHVYHDY